MILKIVIVANVRVRVGHAVKGHDQIVGSAGIVRCGDGRNQVALAAIHDKAGRGLSRRRLAAPRRWARRTSAIGGTGGCG